MKKNTDAQMHSAEHILNQTMIRKFQCGRCFNAHIEKKKSKCDYYFDRALTEVELADLEQSVNEIIASDLPVTEELLSFAEAQAAYDLGKLPSKIPEQIRIVKIGSYDACPCIGEHVSSTGAIGRFEISSSSYKDEVLRIRYKLKQD